MRTRAATILSLAVLGTSVAFAQEPTPDIDISLPQQARLSAEIPVRVATSGPASYTVIGDVVVGNQFITRTTLTGQLETTGELVLLPLTIEQRREINAAADRAGRAPLLELTVRAKLAGGPDELRATAAGRLRRAPFFDARLRRPERPAERATAVAFDLTDGFKQVVGALAGTPALGTFHDEAAGEGCSVRISGAGTTARRAAKPDFTVRRKGTTSRGRWWAGSTEALAVLRSPKAFGNARPYVVFRVTSIRPPAGCATATRAALRRAVTTARVRLQAPEPGPGYEVA